MSLTKKCDVLIATVERVPTRGWREAIERGMSQNFPNYSWQLAYCGTGEAGGVADIALSLPRDGVHHVTYPWHGVPAKAKAYQAIFETALQAGAEVCWVVNPAATTSAGERVDAFLWPGLHGSCDLVTPRYRGAARQHVLSASLVSPMLLAFLGGGPRFPLSTEFAVSRRLMGRLWRRQDWDAVATRLTPELWMHFAAVAEGCRLAETLVSADTVEPAPVPLAWQESFAQVVDSLFRLMEQNEALWEENARPSRLDQFGRRQEVSGPEPDGERGLEALVRFVEAYEPLRGVCREVLEARTAGALDDYWSRVKGGQMDADLADRVWVRAMFEAAAAWKRRRWPRQQVVGLLAALFRARAGAFLLRTNGAREQDVEADVARLRETCQVLRPVLRRLWFQDSLRPLVPVAGRPWQSVASGRATR